MQRAGGCTGQGGSGWGAGAAPQRGGRVRVCDGAGAGGKGELLGHRRGGRARGAAPDAGAAGLVPVGLGAVARRARRAGCGVAAMHPGDLIGPGIAVDETAQLKHGEATACVAPQHAGITGQVENCVTAVFCAYVTTSGQAWTDFDVYMPDRAPRTGTGARQPGSPATW